MPVVLTKKRVTMTRVHPLTVVADLRRGSLKSLDRYLAQQKGLPDRAVALELRKLISGSVRRTSYRLIVIEHPDKPVDKGGRPTNVRRLPTSEELEVAEELNKSKKPGKVKVAVGAIVDVRGGCDATVYEFARRVAEHKASVAASEKAALVIEGERQEQLLRRDKALRRLTRLAKDSGK